MYATFKRLETSTKHHVFAEKMGCSSENVMKAFPRKICVVKQPTSLRRRTAQSVLFKAGTSQGLVRCWSLVLAMTGVHRRLRSDSSAISKG